MEKEVLAIIAVFIVVMDVNATVVHDKGISFALKQDSSHTFSCQYYQPKYE